MGIYKYTPDEMEQAENDYENRKLVPDGTYNACIIKADDVISQTTQQQYVSIEIEIMDEGYKGRRVWDNIFLNSEKGRGIALHKVHDYLRATNQPVNGIFDTSTLAGWEIIVEVTTEQNKSDGRKRNAVKVYPQEAAVKSAATEKTPDIGPDSFASDEF